MTAGPPMMAPSMPAHMWSSHDVVGGSQSYPGGASPADMATITSFTLPEHGVRFNRNGNGKECGIGFPDGTLFPGTVARFSGEYRTNEQHTVISGQGANATGQVVECVGDNQWHPFVVSSKNAQMWVIASVASPGSYVDLQKVVMDVGPVGSAFKDGRWATGMQVASGAAWKGGVTHSGVPHVMRGGLWVPFDDVPPWTAPMMQPELRGKLVYSLNPDGSPPYTLLDGRTIAKDAVIYITIKGATGPVALHLNTISGTLIGTAQPGQWYKLTAANAGRITLVASTSGFATQTAMFTIPSSGGVTDKPEEHFPPPPPPSEVYSDLVAALSPVLYWPLDKDLNDYGPSHSHVLVPQAGGAPYVPGPALGPFDHSLLLPPGHKWYQNTDHGMAGGATSSPRTQWSVFGWAAGPQQATASVFSMRNYTGHHSAWYFGSITSGARQRWGVAYMGANGETKSLAGDPPGLELSDTASTFFVVTSDGKTGINGKPMVLYWPQGFEFKADVPITIGDGKRVGDQGYAPFNGRVAGIAVVRKVISDAEFAALYATNAGRP
jgi:hypothetical protein